MTRFKHNHTRISGMFKTAEQDPKEFTFIHITDTQGENQKDYTKWKVVALHRGPYGATYDTTDIRDAWTPVFDELGIDLVLSGHDHNYVRSYPMRNNVKVNDVKGTIYIAANTGRTKFYKKNAFLESDRFTAENSNVSCYNC